MAYAKEGVCVEAGRSGGSFWRCVRTVQRGDRDRCKCLSFFTSSFSSCALCFPVPTLVHGYGEGGRQKAAPDRRRPPRGMMKVRNSDSDEQQRGHRPGNGGW